MKVSFGSTFKVPLKYQVQSKSYDTLEDNIKCFIQAADKDIRGNKDISVYSDSENCYYLDITNKKNDKKVKELAAKLGVTCYKVPRENMASMPNNILVSTGKGAPTVGTELDALAQVLDEY